MVKSIDLNGNKISVGDDVLVPRQNPTDIHKKEFVGKIKEFRNSGAAVVVDDEGMSFDIAPNRLESVTFF